MGYKNKKDRSSYGKSHYQKYRNYYIEKAKEHNKKYKERNLKFVNRVKSIYGCQICGYKKLNQALEFHHLDSIEKDSSISKLCSGSYGIKKLKKELRKCVLLCCRCHREVHILKGDLG